MIRHRSFRFLLNRRHGTPGIVVLPRQGFRRAKIDISLWPGYAPTPLLDLPAIAAGARVASLSYKDESGRFGLGSFKALGGAYAVARLLVGEVARQGISPARTVDMILGRHKAITETITVTCATDGNHGRSVAWGARTCHCRSVIFVHEGVSQGRRDAIAQYGAEIRVVPGTYDDAVRAASAAAAEHGWQVVSDTSWEGYTEVPRTVMQGYRVMAEEAFAAMPRPPTHLFVQGGVGGLAAAVSVQSRATWPDAPPKLVVVEPTEAACLLESAEAGRPVALEGALDTLQAGLACGEPSLLAWQELERAAFAFMAIPDASAVDCMRLLQQQEPAVTAGESAVAGLAGLLLASKEPFMRLALELDQDSRVLVFGTEGATDPALYRQLVDDPAA